MLLNIDLSSLLPHLNVGVGTCGLAATEEDDGDDGDDGDEGDTTA